MKIDLEGLGERGGGSREGAHLPDHGQNDREGVCGGGLEGNMEDGGSVDDCVDSCERIDS